jgi:hypothetical protein
MGWVVKATPLPFYTLGRDPVIIAQDAGRGKSRPVHHRDSNPGPSRPQLVVIATELTRPSVYERLPSINESCQLQYVSNCLHHNGLSHYQHHLVLILVGLVFVTPMVFLCSLNVAQSVKSFTLFYSLLII